MNKRRRSKFLGPVAVVFNSANTGSWRINRPDIDVSRCIKCGVCVVHCPTDVMEMKEQGIEIQWKYCKGCGMCAEVCPKKCITMIEEGGGESK